MGAEQDKVPSPPWGAGWGSQPCPPLRDSLLLEAGFLAVLVAPLRLLRWGSPAWRPHDSVTFWGVRWLLFRLMFASGVVKLSSRCPTWWGLTGEGCSSWGG